MTTELPAYEAMDPKDRNPKRSVEFRETSGKSHWLKHTDRHYMSCAPDGRTLAIFFYSINVVLWGRNLREVAAAIDGQNVAWVQEFDPVRWTDPRNNEPFVERMGFFMKKEPDADISDTAKPTKSDSHAKH